MSYNRTSANRYSAKYQRISQDERDRYDGSKKEKRIPYRAIGLAIFLFLGGSFLLIMGSLLLAGYIIPQEYADRTWPLIIIGSLMFIPGAYHTRIAYYAYKGYVGFTFDDIPEFDK